MLKSDASDQTPDAIYILSCVYWLALDSHVTAGHGREHAVLAVESHHLSQMWGQLTGSDGPPFDVEEHCAQVTAGEGLFPACDKMHSCKQQHGVDDACAKVVIASEQKPNKKRDNKNFVVVLVSFAVEKRFDPMQDARQVQSGGIVSWQPSLCDKDMSACCWHWDLRHV